MLILLRTSCPALDFVRVVPLVQESSPTATYQSTYLLTYVTLSTTFHFADAIVSVVSFSKYNIIYIMLITFFLSQQNIALSSSSELFSKFQVCTSSES